MKKTTDVRMELTQKHGIVKNLLYHVVGGEMEILNTENVHIQTVLNDNGHDRIVDIDSSSSPEDISFMLIYNINVKFVLSIL